MLQSWMVQELILKTYQLIQKWRFQILIVQALVKIQSSDNISNNFNNTANSKVIPEHNASLIAKIDEVTLGHLKANILKDLRKQYPSATYYFNSTIVISLQKHIEFIFDQSKSNRKLATDENFATDENSCLQEVKNGIEQRENIRGKQKKNQNQQKLRGM